jgi:hypothetical protein
MTEVTDVYSIYRITDKISDEERIRSKGLGFWSGLGDVVLKSFGFWSLGDSGKSAK